MANRLRHFRRIVAGFTLGLFVDRAIYRVPIGLSHGELSSLAATRSGRNEAGRDEVRRGEMCGANARIIRTHTRRRSPFIISRRRPETSADLTDGELSRIITTPSATRLQRQLTTTANWRLREIAVDETDQRVKHILHAKLSIS